jgi:hypothetical protein
MDAVFPTKVGLHPEGKNKTRQTDPGVDENGFSADLAAPARPHRAVIADDRIVDPVISIILDVAYLTERIILCAQKLA